MSGKCIAMWSGPRNISTAMMRAWENRPDTQVIDEPFYAHFLQHTGLDHPMREQIIDSGETDWRVIAASLSTLPDEGIYYQKHITTHWLEHFSTNWLSALDHVFLIREPSAVVASYSLKRQGLTPSDLGYAQQAALFDHIKSQRGQTPMVIDSERFLIDPASHLIKVCEGLNIDYDENMLSWPAGSRKSDGLWSAHWYEAVNQSTGFSPPKHKDVSLDTEQQRVADICTPYYRSMLGYAI